MSTRIHKITAKSAPVLLLLVAATYPLEATAQSLANRMANGETFHVSFTGSGCPNDAGWKGASDPMGTLKCGETYRVTYRGGTWSVTGYNEGTRKVGTWAYKNVDPRQNRMNIWGRVYSFSNNGDVYDQQYGRVGTIRMRSAGRTPSKPVIRPPAVPGKPKVIKRAPSGPSCAGVRGKPRPPLSAGADALRVWLRCNRI